jgi:hypothetical protein
MIATLVNITKLENEHWVRLRIYLLVLTLVSFGGLNYFEELSEVN